MAVGQLQMLWRTLSHTLAAPTTAANSSRRLSSENNARAHGDVARRERIVVRLERVGIAAAYGRVGIPAGVHALVEEIAHLHQHRLPRETHGGARVGVPAGGHRELCVVGVGG